MRSVAFIFIGLLVGGQVYGANKRDSMAVVVQPLNPHTGVVYYVHENGNMLKPFDFLYRSIFSSSLSQLSRKQLLQFIDKVEKESRLTTLSSFVYQRLVDIALSSVLESTVRAKAIDTLREVGFKRSSVYRSLAKVLVLSSTPPLVRKAIAQYLETIKPKDPIVNESLALALLHDSKPFVRKASAVALGAIQPEDTLIVGKLRYSAFWDKNGGVKQSALSALFAIRNINNRCSQAFEKS